MKKILLLTIMAAFASSASAHEHGGGHHGRDALRGAIGGAAGIIAGGLILDSLRDHRYGYVEYGTLPPAMYPQRICRTEYIYDPFYGYIPQSVCRMVYIPY